MTVLTLPTGRYAPVRAFSLTLNRDKRMPDSYGLTLRETYGTDPGRALNRPTATLPAVAARHVLDRVVTAVSESGHRPSVLSVERAKPIGLTEPAGVRLALTMLAVSPLRAADTTFKVAAGIAAMSVEETFYWYSLCTGESAQAGRKAIRILLAGA